ncbi:hypothetical protein B0H13DRAFT_1911539 [Mycena leptocephala]|nr:hypothetical protein B0H13DRAFT_1911539 [Mycena leptocephala]
MQLTETARDHPISLDPLDSVDKLEASVRSWVFAAGYRVRLYAVVHELRTTITTQREAARLEKNAKQRATRRGKKKKASYDSELDNDDEEMGEESSTDDEVDEHPRSSPIPPAPKRTRRVLEEVTNEPVRAPRTSTQRAARKPLQRAAELWQCNCFYIILAFAFRLIFITFWLFILGFTFHLSIRPTPAIQQHLELLRLVPFIAQISTGLSVLPFLAVF